uniref:Uncharacterized protein n=1 Tax=Kalanchoe fedtschenkoi TaxID=63787 RepID=A0A7N0T3C4_KALFE
MPLLAEEMKMRSYEKRGGSAAGPGPATSSCTAAEQQQRRRSGGGKHSTDGMLHHNSSSRFDSVSCDVSDYSGSRRSDSSLLPTFHHNRQSSKNPTEHNILSPPAVSPYKSSPWTRAASMDEAGLRRNGLIGSILREEGHVYSLAAAGDLLFTGSDSKNIRVWKGMKEFSGFKSGSGLVKAIVISGEKIFTGHQDGKIRVWRAGGKDPSVYKRVGSLPNFKEFVKKSFNPKNYVEVRRHRNVLRIRHYDAVSCMSLDEVQGLLYSGSWDRTLKVWRVSDSKCVDSVNAHDDAVNAVVAGFGSLVFTGSADGTVKAWRREFDLVNGKTILTHSLQQVLLKQENAVTALAANLTEGWLYGGASDGMVNFWECGSKKLSHGGVLRGHKLAVLCMEAAGALVFSGGADKSICVWRRGDGGVHTCLSVLSGHTGPVKCLAAREDEDESGKVCKSWVVYSGSLDKTVKVWRVSEQSPDLKKMHLV